MQRKSMTWALAFAAVFAVSFLAWGSLGGAAGVVIPYAGTLEAAGVPVDGTADFSFDVFPDAVTTTPCATIAANAVSVTRGAFALNIAGIPEACVAGKDVHLGISVRQGTAPLVTVGKQRVVPALSALTSGSGDFVAGVITAAGVNASGTVSAGALAVPTGGLTFGSVNRQMLTLYNEDFGFGVQTDTMYARAHQFGWFTGGSHADGLLDPGPGGVLTMNLTGAGNLTTRGTVNSLELGSFGFPTFLGMRHGALKGTLNDNYAMIQSSSGAQTIVNAAPGGGIELRIGDVPKLTMDSVGRLTSAAATGATVIPMAPSGLPREGTFVSRGGRHLILASVSGFAATAGSNMTAVIIDNGVVLRTMTMFSTEREHMTLPTAMFVVNLQAGNHLFRLQAQPDMGTDAGDTSELTVIELP